MRKTFRQSVKILCAFLLIFTLIFNITDLNFKFKKVHSEEETETTAGIVYDPAEFTMVEDYAAFVGATKQYGNYDVGKFDPNNEMTMRLDAGKSGLLVSSVQTGADVEGKSFGFKNKFTGNFNIDFRVFSQESYYGKRDLSGKEGLIDGVMQPNGTLLDGRWNPFLDIRILGIKITSATNPEKSFTVYVYGYQPWGALETAARVYIEGETYTDAGRKGYGLLEGVNAPRGDGYATELVGTSFCNVSGRQKESYFNTIKFDVEKMSVYGTAKILSGNRDGFSYTEKDLLIRNIGTNNLKDDNSDKFFSAPGLKTLDKRDFEGGYYVDIIIEDMTEDDVPLKKPVGKSGGDEVYGNCEGQPIPGYENGYPRRANIIIYNVNGQDFRKYEGFETQALEHTFNHPAAGQAPTGFQTTKGATVKALATGTAAEGNSFSLKTEDFMYNGAFGLLVKARAKNYAPKAGTENYIDFCYDDAVSYATGLGRNYIEWDPYSDVREIGVTFRSRTDKTKAFTAYISTRDTKRMAVSVRVGVEGESYRDGSGAKGFGGNPNTNTTVHAGAKGTFGMFSNTGNDTYNDQRNPYVTLRFNPATMVVETYAYNWVTVRDLKNPNAVGESARPYIRTLSPEDFAGGFDVSIEIVSMTPNYNRGLANVYQLTWNGNSQAVPTGYAATDGNYVLSEAYEREAILDVLAYKDANFSPEVSDEPVTAPDNLEAQYIEQDYWLDLNAAKYIPYGQSVLISPKLTNVFRTIDVPSEEITFAHESSDHSGALTDDGMFSPNRLGQYTFLYGGYAQNLIIIDAAPPTIQFKDGLSNLIISGQGALSLSVNDVIAADDWGKRGSIDKVQIQRQRNRPKRAV